MKIKHDGSRIIVSDLPASATTKTISCELNPRANIATNLERAAKYARQEASAALLRAELFDAAARHARAEGIE